MPLFLMLAACATPAAVDDPEFRAGYEAGCAAAQMSRTARATIPGDQTELFRRGYMSGLHACGGEIGR